MIKTTGVSFLLTAVIFFSCGNASLKFASTTAENETPQLAKSSADQPAFSPGNDLIGDWKLSVETYDENQNKKLDPQERTKAFSNHFFLRFNADGSALVNYSATAEHALKAKYKLSKRKDLQFISIYIDGDDNEGPDGLSGGY